MRILGTILAAALAGTAIGTTWAYLETRPSDAATQPASSAPVPATDDSSPRVEVDATTFNFGTMQRGTTKSHGFTFKNVGQSPLMLKVGSTSCKCTIGDVSDAPIQPGDSVEVKLDWSALVNTGPFRQTAAILTNDPRNSRIELVVEGDVGDASGVLPPDLVFDKISTGESKSAEVYVMTFAQDSLEVSQPELSNTETREFFDVQIEPVPPADLPHPKAKAGVRVRVTSKPGLRQGRFDQWLTLTTNIPDTESLKIPIFGRVVGNISVYGRMWNDEQGVLRFGNVKSSEGATAQLNVVIRGSDAGKLKLSVASVDPPEMRATLGEPKKVRADLVHVPLVVEIPPGTPPMARLDIDQHDEARIILKTDDPKLPEMLIGVRFAVER